MTYEKETLKLLRQSLDEEDDETSIIPILESHHKYLREYIAILTSAETSTSDKQATASLFFPIFLMHAKSEEEVFYETLKHATNKEVRLDGLRGTDEHEIAYQLIEELKDMGAFISWSEEVDAKIQVLSGLVKNHLKEEENIIFPLVEEYIPESKLMNLSADYLDKCRIYLDHEMEDYTLAVSRTDVMTFFY